jgi:hypothetical protein
MWLCMGTREGHVVVLEIVSRAGVGNPQVVFAYTVWQ